MLLEKELIYGVEAITESHKLPTPAPIKVIHL